MILANNLSALLCCLATTCQYTSGKGLRLENGRPERNFRDDLGQSFRLTEDTLQAGGLNILFYPFTLEKRLQAQPPFQQGHLPHTLGVLP